MLGAAMLCCLAAPLGSPELAFLEVSAFDVCSWHFWDLWAGWDRVRFRGETGHRPAAYL